MPEDFWGEKRKGDQGRSRQGSEKLGYAAALHIADTLRSLTLTMAERLSEPPVDNTGRDWRGVGLQWFPLVMEHRDYMTADGREVHGVFLSLDDLNREHAKLIAELQPMLDQVAQAQRLVEPFVELSRKAQAQVQPMLNWVSDLEAQVETDYTRVVSRSAQLARGRKVYAESVRNVMALARARGWSHVWLASMALEGDSAAIKSLWTAEPDEVVLLLRWLVSGLQRLEGMDLLAAVHLRRAVRQLHAVSQFPVLALSECDPPVPRSVFVGSIDTNGPNHCTSDVPHYAVHAAGAAA